MKTVLVTIVLALVALPLAGCVHTSEDDDGDDRPWSETVNEK